MIIRLICIILSVFLVPVQALCLEISLLTEATVSSNAITLGDIANFDESNDLTRALQTQIIGKSPKPGQAVSLKSMNIKRYIERNTALPSLTTWKGQANVTVLRSGQKVGPDQLLEAVDNFIDNSRPKLPDAKIHFVAKSLPLPFLIPEGKIDWELIPSNPSILSSSRLSVIIRVDGKVEKNISLIGAFQAMAPVATVTSSLKRGETLTPANTRIEERDITRIRNATLDLRQVLGKRLKRSLRQGHAISLSDVEFPPLVRKGQLVKIIVNQGNLFLTATGVAKNTGKLNQIIRVRNTSSNKLIFCKVSAPGIVEVSI